jgi:hypothetical protein
VNQTTPCVEPDPAIKPIAGEVWSNLVVSEKEKRRFAADLAKTLGPWWHVHWEDGRLGAVRQIIRARAGTAFGGGTIGSVASSALGSPRVACDGELISADGEPADADLLDDLAFATARISKSLNWRRVVLQGSELFQVRFRHHALHEADFYTWAIETARTLRQRRPPGIDWASIAEEVEDLARSERRALKSQLARLLQHLLKWSHKASPHVSWRRSIEDSRDEIRELLEDNPGLRAEIPELMKRAYRSARRDACDETGLAESAFPADCPWTFHQIADDAFWPSPAQANGRARKPAPRTRRSRPGR